MRFCRRSRPLACLIKLNHFIREYGAKQINYEPEQGLCYQGSCYFAISTGKDHVLSSGKGEQEIFKNKNCSELGKEHSRYSKSDACSPNSVRA